MRMRMAVRIQLEPGAKAPTYAHPDDAGADLYALNDGIVLAHDMAAFRTGVHMQIPSGYYGDIRSKSGMMLGRQLQTDGTIDAGYTGEIMVMLFNHGDYPQNIHAGDKIAQIIIKGYIPAEFEVVDHVTGGERGSTGFGSTGR